MLGFIRLKHLDLSRNAIETLEGLEQLTHLETLNLYYNNVPSLKELLRLKHNTKLKSLDLRLNPVTKNEPDYRLFVVHMLVNLRKLDDRSVRDNERKAALMHFDSDQAREFSEHQRNRTDHGEKLPDIPKHISSRTDLVQSLAPRPTALEDDTDHLLDLIAKTDTLLTPARPKQTQSQQSGAVSNKSPGLSPLGYDHSHHDHVTPESSSLKSHSSRRLDLSDSLQRNLDFKDEYQVYSDIVVKGNFTPAPVLTVANDEAAPVHLSQESDGSEVNELLQLIRMHVCGGTKTLQLDSAFKDKLKEWWSSHGLSKPAARVNKEVHDELKALQEQVKDKDSLLLQKDSDLSKMKERLQQCESEAAVLGGRLQALTAELGEVRKHDSANRQTRQLLNQANKDLATLRLHVQCLQDENSTLKSSADLAPSTSRLVELEKNLRLAEADNSSLRQEVAVMTEKHKQNAQSTAQMHQLAAMLQESHGALVTTNDHLLKELEDTKRRHKQEIAQMNLNYQELRKTIELR